MYHLMSRLLSSRSRFPSTSYGQMFMSLAKPFRTVRTKRGKIVKKNRLGRTVNARGVFTNYTTKAPRLAVRLNSANQPIDRKGRFVKYSRAARYLS
jgi:hypothetical protein